MIGRRNGEQRFFAERLVVHQGLVVACQQQTFGLGLEADRPLIGIRHVRAPCVRVEVVHQIAASDDEDAFGPQRGQLPANFIVERGQL